MVETNKTRIGAYEIMEQVGSGGMATVYRATQSKLGRDVAVKVMHQQFAQDVQFLARFQREARIIAKLDHPNIVPIYDYDEHNNQPYLVMKYIDGLTLKDLLNRGMLSLDEIKSLMWVVAEALDYAHTKGVLHRDFKPSNIIIGRDGTPYLTDFGLARLAAQGESTMSADTMLGTPQYISPEQAQGLKDLDARTDVYAMGVVLYELVVGRVPFLADSAYAIIHKQIYAAPPTPSELNPELTPTIDRVLLKALAKDPAARYSTPITLMQAFEAALSSSNITHLDESRQSVAAQRAPDVSEHTPGGGQYVTIPGPTEDAPPVGSSTMPQDASNRFQAFVSEIAAEIGKREIFKKASSTVRDKAREFREATESAATGDGSNSGPGKVRIPTPPSAPGFKGRRHEDRRAVSYGFDDDSIRRRVQKRIRARQEFVIHLLIFIVGMVFFSGVVQPNYVSSLGEAIISPDMQNTFARVGGDFLTPLQEINIAIIVGLLWGTGVISHGLGVFYDSGARLERRRQRIENQLSRAYGPDWREQVDEAAYSRVRKRIEGQRQRWLRLFTHAISTLFISVAAALIWGPARDALQIITTRDLLASPLPAAEAFSIMPYYDFQIGWLVDLPVSGMIAAVLGVLLILHFVFIMLSSAFNPAPAEDVYARELQRERELSGIGRRASAQKAKRKQASDGPMPAVRLTEDGELSASFINELDGDDRARQH